VKKLALLLLFLCPAAAFGQAVSGVGAVVHPLNKHDTNDFKDQTTYANGPRLVSADGGIWFLESNADRIAFFKNDVVTEWPIRSRTYVSPYRSIGANPADFELDGTTIWFIENGTSGIELQQSVFAKLDTVTNELTEWILPTSKPAGFVRVPDGSVWIAMSQGTLLHLHLDTRAIETYRGPNTFAYSGIIPGPGGFLYLTDFGNNRIVRVDVSQEPIVTELAWQMLPPTTALIEPTQPTLDGAGNLFVAEDISGGAIGRLNLATGEYDRFGAGFLLHPSHFFLQGNFVYAVETDPGGGDGRFVIVDMSVATVGKFPTTPVANTLIQPNTASPPATVRTFTVEPLTFTSVEAQPDGVVVASNPTTGVSRFTLPSGTVLTSSTSYSIAPLGGKVVAGVRGALVDFTLLPEAPATDLDVPLAINASNGKIQTDFVAFDGKAPHGNLVATFFSSPAPPSSAKAYGVAANTSLSVPNVLGPGQLNVGDAFGSLLFSPNTLDAGNYQIATRSYALPASGGTYGFSLSAQPVGSGLTVGSTGVIFLGTRSDEVSIFGIYSATGATGTATLHSPDGTVRGTYPFFLPANNRQEFNPAFSAFGVPAELGDTITFDIASGYVTPYASLFQHTGDLAVAVASRPATQFVAPIAGAGSAFSATYVTDFLFANPDPVAAVTLTVTFIPFGGGAPDVSTLTVPPGGATADLAFHDPGLGFGVLAVVPSGPVEALGRYAKRTANGDFATTTPLLTGVATSGRFLVSSDGRLRRNLYGWNAGAPGTVTIRVLNAGGTLRATLALPVGSRQPFVVPNIGVSIAGVGGRIEYSGTNGMALYPWLTAIDSVTGDADPQLPFPP